MAQNYRESLARISQEFDTGVVVPDNITPDQLYMDLAWEGIDKESIIAWSVLTDTEKQRVSNVINNYINTYFYEDCN